MIRKLTRLIIVIMVLLMIGCIKETYDMNMLSKRAHLSPTVAVSAVKGDISLSDLVKSGDTIVFDQNNFVKIVFTEDSVIDLELDDFFALKKMIELNPENGKLTDLKLLNPHFDYPKGTFGQLTATIEPHTLNLEIEEILSHITGEFNILNPILRLHYNNSFLDPIQITLNVTGKRQATTKDLNLAPFVLNYPADAVEHEVSGTYVIDKNNSSLPEIASMLPEEISFSGTAEMNTSGKKSQRQDYVLESNRLTGSIEVEIPLEFRINNLQFTDTVDNFLADAFDDESSINWNDFKLFRVDFDVKNGFPMGVSLKLNLYDSINHRVLSSIDASDILKPAPVDANGKATGVTETSTSIEFTKEFFSSIDKAGQIIFRFTLITTDNGTKDVKIYSDYRIDFKASLVLKPDIKFNLK